MRLPAIAFVLAAPTAAAVDLSVPAPPDDCAAFGGAGARAAEPIFPPDPGFGGLFVLSPPQSSFDVPRNVEVRLGGDVSSLDVEPAQMSVEIVDALGARVPFQRDGLDLALLAPLPPRQTFTIRIEATDANPCPDCFGIQEIAFTTGDEVDESAPVLDGPPPVHVFVMPSDEEAARCGFFFGLTHQIVVDIGPALPLNTWIAIDAKKDGGAVTPLADIFNTGSLFSTVGNVGTTVKTALGDSFFVALTPRDLAGNVGNARIVRLRARSFLDQNRLREELPPLWCDMPTAPVVTAAATLPTNGELAIDFPFEEVPLALRNIDAPNDVIPLVAVADLASGHVYRAVDALPAGAALEVVPLPCPRCVCEGCSDFAPIPVLVGADADTTAPAAPVVLALREDIAPDLAVEGPCHPDRPAVVAVLEPGRDDHAGPLELRYDANIRVDGGPQLVLGRSLIPFARGDGSIALRMETPSFGRLLGHELELTLEAIDGAGNRASSSFAHGDDKNGGCTATSAGSPGPLAFLALVLTVRRRLRA
jgi:hypothetical protein